jgi:SAM-dependent methyltransferase
MQQEQGGATAVRCAICGFTQTRTLYTKFGYDIGRCVRCGLVYVNPRPPDATILARYSSEYFWKEYLPALGVVDGHYDLARFDTRYAPWLDLLGPPEGRRLLEIGCGAGFFLKSAERRGWQVAGVEVSEVAARFATERLDLDVRVTSAETLPFSPATFGVAVMFDTIEHLFDPRMALSAISRVLTPRGRLLVATPNYDALSRWLLGPSWAVLSPFEHMYYFDEKSLRRLMETCGFDTVQFVRQHPAWTPQETMNFMYTHCPGSVRVRFAALISRVGGYRLAREVQRVGRQDILLCLSRLSERGAPPRCD